LEVRDITIPPALALTQRSTSSLSSILPGS
jgi:hypothetical protein